MFYYSERVQYLSISSSDFPVVSGTSFQTISIDRHSTAEYIEQEENEQEEAGYSPGITEEEVNADQQEGDNHPRNSVIDQLLAADPVNDHKSKNGGQSVD